MASMGRSFNSRSRRFDDTGSHLGMTNLFATRTSHTHSEIASEADSAVADRRFMEMLGVADESVAQQSTSYGPIRNVGHRLYAVGCGREKLKQDHLRAERERVMMDEMACFTQRPAITTRARSKPSKGAHFADHALLWEEKKNERLMRMEYERIQNLQSKMQATPTINDNCDRILTDYVGPVQGWNAHFAKFCSKRNPPVSRNMFSPNINSNAIRRDGDKPIGERLFQESFCRQQRREAQSASQQEREMFDPATGRKLFKPQAARSTSSQSSSRNPLDVTTTLHEASKSREEMLEELRKNYDDKECTFSPQLNRTSMQLSARSRKPLYEPKRSKSAEPEAPASTKEKITPEQMRAFLLRNEKALRDKHAHVEALKLGRVNADEEQCTFHPEINRRSEQIFAMSNVFGVPMSDSPIVVPTLWQTSQSATPISVGPMQSPTPRFPGGGSATRQPVQRSAQALGPAENYISNFEQQMMSVLDEWKKLEDV